MQEQNKYTIIADELKGANIYLDMPSVGATINIMLAAVKANGTTTIDNAAKEPEIVNVATFLNNMGAKIRGAGTSTITIKGVKELHHAYTEVIPDRIEAGTYVIAGALIGNQLKIDNIIPEHIDSLLEKLKEMGVDISVGVDNVIVSKTDRLNPINVTTLGYPGFPTDLQQPLTTLLTKCDGLSTVKETIYENRFCNAKYLNEMGANIKITDKKIYVNGPSELVGKEVIATDLRAGACLVLAGLVAKGTTTVKNVEHVLRGYENIIEKLNNVGANIKLDEI
jgi:UDP-N-acetylglucosamine 1-carboxyvinyltransferase